MDEVERPEIKGRAILPLRRRERGRKGESVPWTLTYSFRWEFRKSQTQEKTHPSLGVVSRYTHCDRYETRGVLVTRLTRLRWGMYVRESPVVVGVPRRVLRSPEPLVGRLPLDVPALGPLGAALDAAREGPPRPTHEGRVSVNTTTDENTFL